MAPFPAPAPPPDCQLCPRLAGFRQQNREKYPAYHNNPVPPFAGADPPRLLIVGLAPGLQGANATGRPFTNDYAGDLLYETLGLYGFAEGQYDCRADDGLRLKACRITNAVRCVPPENKPLPEEIKTCGSFLKAELGMAMPSVRAIVALGTVAHAAVLSARGLRKAAFPFAHGAVHDLGDGVRLFDSYHCSRYNTNTGRLTTPMFQDVFRNVRAWVDGG
ncbi:MAG: uracil-DNA glycosylase [Pseudomonadota bacterium]|nr:uracil-DNA glycosylase [Pseudomonadota bacterium]